MQHIAVFLSLYRTIMHRCVNVIQEADAAYKEDAGRKCGTWETLENNDTCCWKNQPTNKQKNPSKPNVLSWHFLTNLPSPVTPHTTWRGFLNLCWAQREASHANHDGCIQQRSKYFSRHFLCDSSTGQQSCSLATTVLDWWLRFNLF